MRNETFTNILYKSIQFRVSQLIVNIITCCIVVKILNLKHAMRLMQKTYLFSVLTEMPLENTLKSV
jgi:hypothetical protein